MIKQKILLVLGLLCVFSSQAQDDTYNENVTINVAFDPMISDANKINNSLSIFDTSFTKIDFSFDRIKKGYATHLDFDTIKAAFGYSTNPSSCTSGNYFRCVVSGLAAYAHSRGDVTAEVTGYYSCNVNYNGSSNCHRALIGPSVH